MLSPWHIKQLLHLTSRFGCLTVAPRAPPFSSIAKTAVPRERSVCFKVVPVATSAGPADHQRVAKAHRYRRGPAVFRAKGGGGSASRGFDVGQHRRPALRQQRPGPLLEIHNRRVLSFQGEKIPAHLRHRVPRRALLVYIGPAFDSAVGSNFWRSVGALVYLSPAFGSPQRMYGLECSFFHKTTILGERSFSVVHRIHRRSDCGYEACEISMVTMRRERRGREKPSVLVVDQHRSPRRPTRTRPFSFSSRLPDITKTIVLGMALPLCLPTSR